MENRVNISLAEYEKLKELSEPKLTFWDYTIICPYCQHENKYRQFEVCRGKNNQFVYCDSEDGGCDEQFILQTEVKSTLTHKSYKIPE